MEDSKNEPESQEAMWAVCRKLPSDFEPYGERSRGEGLDCSSGCRHFVPLSGSLAIDWGVCANPESPRAGLLTFGHQGCLEFEPEEGVQTEEVAEPAPLPRSQRRKDEGLRSLPIDWDDVEMAIYGNFDLGGGAYLNKETGEIVLIFPGMDDEEELRERIEEDWGDWIDIDPIDSRTGFEIMERFASSQKKPGVRKLLFDALSGPRPFRRFKDAVGLDEGVRKEWFAFEAAAQKEAMEEWLADQGIEPEWKSQRRL